MALTTDREKCAHLLRRFGLGASEAELDYYLKDGGLSGAVDKLLNYEQTDEGFNLPIDRMRNAKDALNMTNVVAWWATRMLVTQRPVQEKMTLFWHDHFATSADKVKRPHMMYSQNEVLRRNATGSFRQLLLEVSQDPAMLVWLDNVENVAGKPNENFAREVMELFTLGIGNYEEKDVQEGARAFTGWSYRSKDRDDITLHGQSEFVLNAKQHDNGEKTFLGKTGDFGGEDILKILCDDPRCSMYITEKIWNWFVYQNPDHAVVEKYAAVFRGADLNIKALLRAIVTGPEFYSAQAERTIVKNPVDFCISTMRQLGIGAAIAADLKSSGGTGLQKQLLRPSYLVSSTMKSMGLYIFYPPDVSGWPSQNAWISTGTMVERMKWAEKVLNGYPSVNLFGDQPTPDGIVAKLVSVFDAPIHAEKVPVLVQAAQTLGGGAGSSGKPATMVSGITRLIFALPEFQFA